MKLWENYWSQDNAPHTEHVYKMEINKEEIHVWIDN
jgi:hypothetical protein